MKILLIGGNGTIGKRLYNELSKRHEVIVGGRSAGDVQIDIADSQSIEACLASIEDLDAIVCAAGEAKWAPLEALSEEDFYIGIRSKLMGQVNLVRIGEKYLNPRGSITLTTGVLADDPVFMTTSAALVNGGINSFTKAAALEMKNGQRVNVVCAGLVADAAEKYRDYFPGHNPVPMDKVVNGYVKSIEGLGNGEIIYVY